MRVRLLAALLLVLALAEPAAAQPPPVIAGEPGWQLVLHQNGTVADLQASLDAGYPIAATGDVGLAADTSGELRLWTIGERDVVLVLAARFPSPGSARLFLEGSFDIDRQMADEELPCPAPPAGVDVACYLFGDLQGHVASWQDGQLGVLVSAIGPVGDTTTIDRRLHDLVERQGALVPIGERETSLNGGASTTTSIVLIVGALLLAGLGALVIVRIVRRPNPTAHPAGMVAAPPGAWHPTAAAPPTSWNPPPAPPAGAPVRAPHNPWEPARPPATGRVDPLAPDPE